jgi:hypothetical protein
LRRASTLWSRKVLNGSRRDLENSDVSDNIKLVESF